MTRSSVTETGVTEESGGYCFGYGSLANAETHSFEIIGMMSLRGWRRSWAHWVTSSDRKATSLTIVPSGTSDVLGALLRVPASGWAGLAERENGYDLSFLDPSLIEEHPSRFSTTETCQTYISRQENRGGDDHPIFLSYIDTVAQGFLRVGGEDAAGTFFNTTDGWSTPVLNDRAAPRYPRATVLSHSEQSLVDDALAGLAVRWSETL